MHKYFVFLYISYLLLDSFNEFKLMSLITVNIPEVSEMKNLVTLQVLSIVTLGMVIGCQEYCLVVWWRDNL
jgi:hypothetical protein